MTPYRARLILFVMLLIAVVSTPFLGRSRTTTARQIESNQDALRHLTNSQRERLFRNLETYQSLPNDRREQVVKLNNALIADARQGGDLIAVMEVYCDWLNTLSPLQRDAIEKISDPKQRVEKMKEQLKYQREDAVRRNHRSAALAENWPKPMSDETRHAIMSKLEDLYQNRLSPASFAELSELSGIKRDLQLLKLIKQANSIGDGQGLHTNPPPEFAEIAAHINQYSQEKEFTDFISTGLRQDFMPEGQNSIPEEFQQADKRLVMSLWHAFGAESFRLRRLVESNVKADVLKDFFNTRSEADQEDLLSWEASKFETDLKNLYLESNGANDLPSWKEMAEIFGEPRRRGNRGSRGRAGDSSNSPGKGMRSGGPTPGAPPGGPGAEFGMPPVLEDGQLPPRRPLPSPSLSL